MRVKTALVSVICLLLSSTAVPGYGAKPGDTIYGKVEAYESLSSGKKDALIEDAKLAKAAYENEPIPEGYRPATMAEFSEYIGKDMVAQRHYIRYNQHTGYFDSIGNRDVGWLGLGSGDGNGLDGRLLVNEADGSIVLAFRGSEASYNDWVRTDFYQPIGGLPEQYTYASEMLNFLVNNTSDGKPEIKVVGHSLGGGLAAYSTLNCSDVSRVNTSTFNAAGLYPRNVNRTNISEASRKINNVRVDRDAVSQTGLLVGDTYVVDSDWFYGSDNGWLDSVVDTGHAHSMNTTLMLMMYSRNQDGTEPPSSSNPDDGTTPGGDLVTSPGSGDASGDVCLPGDGLPDGDYVSSGGFDDWDWGYFPEDIPISGDSVSDPSSIVDAATFLLNDIAAMESLIGDSSFDPSALLPGDWSGFPIVMPNVPFTYPRFLYIFSGEKPIATVSDTVKEASSSIQQNISIIRNGIQELKLNNSGN